MDLHGIQPIQLFLKKGKKMYRRIVKKETTLIENEHNISPMKKNSASDYPYPRSGG